MRDLSRPLKRKKIYFFVLTVFLAGMFLISIFAGSGSASLPVLGADAFFPLMVDNSSFGRSTPSPTPTATQTATPTATSPPPCKTVSIADFNFSPASVTIKAGGCVKWTNNGSFTHTTTSDTGIWNSGSLTSGQSFTFTFNSKGTYPYFCAIHPSMTGTVIVN